MVATAHEIGMARRVPLETKSTPLDIKTVITAQYQATGTYTPPGAKVPLTLTKVLGFRFDYGAVQDPKLNRNADSAICVGYRLR